MKKVVLASITVALALCIPRVADAFCGFYVAGSNKEMFNDATQVVLMRMGTRTVLSMQNNYKGPPEAFAMVIPVPTVLQEGDVKTLNREVFQHVDQMGAPRLVEYWEQDPCGDEDDHRDWKRRRSNADASPPLPMVAGAKQDFGVTIEAKFVVGEYQILILSAKDSTGLDGWLRAENYTIPKGAEPLLRPYVEQGMKFFVAKVDPEKVKWVGEGNAKRAELSPLRFHYDSDEFALPIRLGLANSSGTQDLIVNILAPQKRYEVTNYDNVMIPTNIDVSEQMKDQFASFYTALFDRTVEKHPGAVITEYAWQATTCDPCPGPALNYHEFMLLGADVLEGTTDKPQPYRRADFVLTRLHARYGKSITDDLRFKEAQPIAGGREHLAKNGKLEEGWVPNPVNNFQGRYAIRHPWKGAIACAKPVRGKWGGPLGRGRPEVKPALELAYAPRGQVQLSEVVHRDVPELGIKAKTTTEQALAAGRQSGGCGCQASNSGGLFIAFGAAFWLFGRRRPAHRQKR